MDPRLLDYYNTELFHLRESAAEFAKEFPKIASRLTLEGMDCADPYVERLLEGFAYLTARVQLKLDSEYPSFIQQLSQTLYPDYLSPTPSMAIAQFEPDFRDGGLSKGVRIARGSALRARLGADAQTACEFRTAHEVRLWPIRLTSVSFEAHAPVLPRDVALSATAAGALRIRLECSGDVTFDKLDIDELVFHVSGEDRVASRLFEHVVSFSSDAVVIPAAKGLKPMMFGPGAVRSTGMGDDMALLPVSRTGFRGYRLLREYAVMPARFMFFRLRGLRRALSTSACGQIEIVLTLSRAEPDLERLIDIQNLSLYATPIVNLFAKQADRIFPDFKSTDYHVIGDRTRPMDFEIHSIDRVMAHGSDLLAEQEIFPLYAAPEERVEHEKQSLFYSLRREKRMSSANQKQRGTRTAYVGTETFLSLVDIEAPPFPASLKQVSVDVLCTNRDLPLMMPTGQAKGDFTLGQSAPVARIKCLHGPTRPLSPTLDGRGIWQLISQLSINHLSLVDTSAQEGASALRQILMLYGLDPESPMHNQVQGVRSVRLSPIIRRLPQAPTVTFARGYEVELTCDPRYFEGFSPVVLAGVLEEFFARHASINSFTETVLRVQGRGEIKRWKPRLGRRPMF